MRRARSIDGDQLMALIAQILGASGTARGGGIVATVMSQSRARALSGGARLALPRTAVGDRYVVEHMRADGFNVGGEQSGISCFPISRPPATG